MTSRQNGVAGTEDGSFFTCRRGWVGVKKWILTSLVFGGKTRWTVRVRHVTAAEDGSNAKRVKLSSPAPEIAFLQEDSLTPMTTRAGLGWAGLAGWLAGLTACFSL